jgi:glycosyltransferase involved in cell wall biosynthesis
MSTAIQPSSTACVETNSEVTWKGRFEFSKPRLLLLITEDWYFRSHRLDLARAARDAGMEVSIATLAQNNGKWIRDEGFKYLQIPFSKGGRHPLRELSAVVKLTRLYRRERPDIVHHVALKPILYGSWAARMAGIPAVVNAFAGLGSLFIADGWRWEIVFAALKAGLRGARHLRNARNVLQNEEDCERLIQERIITREQAVIIRGVGVDLSVFRPIAEPKGIPIVIQACRMLWDKGVGEFVQAARLLNKQGIQARYVLVGKIDKHNPSRISENQIRAWEREGVIEWWGHRDDMATVLASAQVVVLPSYREGLPKVLLEACACERPVIATAVPGCREIVRNGENGFLIPPKDPETLAKAIAVLLKNPALRIRMGKRGREIVVGEFSAGQIARQTLAVYRELLESSSSP